jgi:hypothetical protein
VVEVRVGGLGCSCRRPTSLASERLPEQQVEPLNSHLGSPTRPSHTLDTSCSPEAARHELRSGDVRDCCDTDSVKPSGRRLTSLSSLRRR